VASRLRIGGARRTLDAAWLTGDTVARQTGMRRLHSIRACDGVADGEETERIPRDVSPRSNVVVIWPVLSTWVTVHIRLVVRRLGRWPQDGWASSEGAGDVAASLDVGSDLMLQRWDRRLEPLAARQAQRFCASDASREERTCAQLEVSCTVICREYTH
jgi:hypothetical protein